MRRCSSGRPPIGSSGEVGVLDGVVVVPRPRHPLGEDGEVLRRCWSGLQHHGRGQKDYGGEVHAGEGLPGKGLAVWPREKGGCDVV